MNEPRTGAAALARAAEAGIHLLRIPTPFQVAPHYRDLPGLELLTPPDEFPSEPAVMVTFDLA